MRKHHQLLGLEKAVFQRRQNIEHTDQMHLHPERIPWQQDSHRLQIQDVGLGRPFGLRPFKKEQTHTKRRRKRQMCGEVENCASILRLDEESTT